MFALSCLENLQIFQAARQIFQILLWDSTWACTIAAQESAHFTPLCPSASWSVPATLPKQLTETG